MTTTTNLISQSAVFAARAHHSVNQLRKYSGEPYIVHPMAVAELVREYTDNEITISAAYLHDVLEDVAPSNPDFTENKLRDLFPKELVDIVVELTDIYTKDKHPELNRHKRHALEVIRLSECSHITHTVKFADMFCNLSDILIQDVNFARTVVQEKSIALESLNKGNLNLKIRLIDLINNAKHRLHIK